MPRGAARRRGDARLHVTAYPEKSAVGIQVWTGKCEVIPQADAALAALLD